MSEEIYDIIIIGAGPGGYHAALRAAQFDAKVAIIEKQYLGGTCSNYGCIPTKALYTSALMLQKIREQSEEMGVSVTIDDVDFSKVVDRKNRIVNELRTGIEGLLKTRKISIFEGYGKIDGGNFETGFTVSVKQDEKITKVKGKTVIIATGSTPALIPAFNIDHKKILTSDDILSPDFKTLPKSLVIIGAGVIGCEFGFIFARYNIKITMLEYLPTMLATEEPRVVMELKKKCVDCGIDLRTNQNVLSIVPTETGIKATTCDAKIPRDQVDSAEKSVFEADLCLVSIGRAKLYKEIGLEEMGINTDRGGIVVNKETMMTNVPGIYAIGDVNNTGLMLAHVASYQGDVAVSQALTSLSGFDIHLKIAKETDVVPYTIFTNPEIGSVGMREKDAKNKLKQMGRKVNVGRFYYASLGKAKCMGEEEGFLMIVVDAETDEILGASCVGAEAPELIAEITVAMQHHITATDLGEVIHSHPTVSEMVLEAAEDVHGLAIHKIGRRK